MFWTYPLLVSLVVQWQAVQPSSGDVCVCDCSKCLQNNDQNETAAATKYKAPEGNRIILRSGSPPAQKNEARQQKRGSNTSRGHANEPAKNKEERRTDVDSSVSNRNYQERNGAGAVRRGNMNNFKGSSNAEDRKASEQAVNSLIERISFEIARIMETEYKALQTERVNTERLWNVRMQLAALSAVKKLDKAFAQLTRSPAGVGNLNEKIRHYVLQNLRKTDHGSDQSSLEKAIQSVTDYIKIG